MHWRPGNFAPFHPAGARNRPRGCGWVCALPDIASPYAMDGLAPVRSSHQTRCWIFVFALSDPSSRRRLWPAHLVQPTITGWLAFTALIVLAIGAAWLFAKGTEDHTEAAR